MTTVDRGERSTARNVAPSAYRMLPLAALVERIVESGDRLALREFHDCRTIFRLPGSEPMLFAQFVATLRDRQAGRLPDEALERVYDLTIDKFLNIPDGRQGPDCRLYFRAFLRYALIRHTDRAADPAIEAEMALAGMLQSLVVRHFHLSCLEAIRSLRFLSRLRTSQFDCTIGSYEMPRGADCEIRERGLPRVVADEKACNIDRQRPAIRALGPHAVRRLVLQILTGILDDDYNESSLAGQFGLSKATFSRFAGARWSPGSPGRIPDLWRNVAQVLARHTAFIEAAQEAGVWQDVKAVISEGGNDA